MVKPNYRLRVYILALICLSALLFNGCALTLPKLTDTTKTDTVKGKKDKSSVINTKSRKGETAKKDVPTITKDKKVKSKSSTALQKKHSFQGSAIGVEKVNIGKEQKLLHKVKILEARLKKEERERKKTSIQIKDLNKKISEMQAAEVKAIEEKHGSGYLSGGSTIGLGIVDGDEELKVLEKVKRLEARLVEENNKVNTLNKELSDLQTAKESVEKEFAESKKSLQDKNDKLLEKIKTLESSLKESEARAIAAENELNPIKKELLKTQISETKAQQELYKLKIEKLKNDEK